MSHLGYSLERRDIPTERFEGMSPEWQKEHEKAFGGQNEAQQHFPVATAAISGYAIPATTKTRCLHQLRPAAGGAVVGARAEAMRRNIDEAADTTTVWKGRLESKTVVCPTCGKPAGTGKFCNNCGASLALATCPQCGAKNAQGVRFCNECGASMTTIANSKCPGCGGENPAGTKFCGNCGTKL